MEEETYFTRSNVIQKVWASIASIGWYLVGVLLVLAYTWPYVHEKYRKWKCKKDEQEYDAKYHKDADIVHDRLTKVELARQRMQEKYNRDLEIAKQKEKELREKKMQEALNKSSELESGHRLGGAEDSNDDSSAAFRKSRRLKKEYNPLMGNSSSRYRPPKRSCCGSSTGGCG